MVKYHAAIAESVEVLRALISQPFEVVEHNLVFFDDWHRTDPASHVDTYIHQFEEIIFEEEAFTDIDQADYWAVREAKARFFDEQWSLDTDVYFIVVRKEPLE